MSAVPTRNSQCGKTRFTGSTVVALLLLVGAHLPAQPVPHHFRGITVLADETVSLSLDGSVSSMFNLTGTVSNQFLQMFDLYPVEVSSNLVDWMPLAVLVRTNSDLSPLLFQDTNVADADHRFYRTPTNHLLTAFPKPTGAYTVGTVDRVMVDPVRTNLYRYAPKTNAFMVTFWYPADPPPAGALPVAMWDKRLAADSALYSYAGMDSRWGSLAPRLLGHGTKGVPLAAGTNRFPVVIYSHGLRSWRKMVSRRAQEFASHGCVFVAMDHSDCWATEFPDGRYLTGNHSGDVPGRLQDMQFLLSELAVLDAGDALLGGRLDLERIGVSGGSYGGMVAQTSRSDSRIKCVALWDAMNLPYDVQKPLLIALGESNSFYSEDLALFNKATNNAVFFQIRGANHTTPSDLGWTAQVPQGRGPAVVNDDCLIWFFDTYLKGESPPFPTNPELYNVQRK